MSWIDKANKRLEIFTGDGKTYFPYWKNATKKLDFNLTIFDFAEVAGSFVDRREKKARQFEMELYFVGDDNIEVSEQFEISLNDKRHIHIRHPFYGDVRCQPTSITFDNSEMNVTKVTGLFLETILGIYPTGLAEPKDEIKQLANTADFTAAFAYSNDVKPSGQDVNFMNKNNDLNAKVTSKKITDSTISSEFLNNYKKSQTAISKAINNANTAMISIQAVVRQPYLLDLSIETKMAILKEQFEKTRGLIVGKPSTPSLRRFYECNTSALFTTMFLSATDAQYSTSTQVLSILSQILELWGIFITDLDNLQEQDYTNSVIYIPDRDNIEAMSRLINTTTGNLLEIARNSKKEFFKYIEKEENAITLTHRFYGLDNEDENLNLFIESNSIGINELLVLKKGRKIVYYA